MRSLRPVLRQQLAHSPRLVSSVRLGLKPRPVRRVCRMRRPQLVCRVHLILRKKRPKPKSARAGSKLTAMYSVNLFEV